MFSNKGREKDIAPPAVPSTPAPVQQPKRAAAGRSSAPSIISSDLVVNGTLTSTGDIQIDGRVEGDVHSSGLVIGDKALIHGEIQADDVTIRGTVQGSIRARKVLLCATSHVEGNILHEAFSVEAGAFFEGNCRHSENPLSDESGRKAQDAAKQAQLQTAAPAAVQPSVAPALVAAKPVEPPRPAAATAATLSPVKTGV